MGIYRFTGELGLCCAVESTHEFCSVRDVLTSVGVIPSKTNTVLCTFSMDIEAESRPAAFTILQDRVGQANNHLEAIGESGVGTRLFIHKADTINRYRGDLLYGYQRQLAIWFNPNEVAHPDLIMENVAAMPGTDQYRHARKRYLKLRRILGLQQFVSANLTLPLSRIDPYKALTYILIDCPGGRELRATYSVLRQRVHLFNEQASVNVYILPGDVHALETAVLHVGHFQPEPWHPAGANTYPPFSDENIAVCLQPAGSYSAITDEDIPF